jgi:phytoene synthase
MDDIQRSYRHCRGIARTRARNFYYSFLVLPHERRQAMCAVYAFMRYCDDIVDEAGSHADKRSRLDAWRSALDEAYTPRNGTDRLILPAFRDTVSRFSIPRAYFEAIIDGAEMDLTVTRYQTFEDLYRYCYHVASAVGLVCIHIFGFSGGEAAKRYAESCGIAFQLTNILRDIREDAEMGRIYLPQQDLRDFACTEEDLRGGMVTDRIRRLMAFEVKRAHGYYEEALPLLPLVHPASRACLAAMIRIYWQNLYEIERRDYNVFGQKIRLPAWKKLAIATGAMIRKRV